MSGLTQIDPNATFGAGPVNGREAPRKQTLAERAGCAMLSFCGRWGYPSAGLAVVRSTA
jgi:hypothetical protein